MSQKPAFNGNWKAFIPAAIFFAIIIISAFAWVIELALSSIPLPGS